MRLLYIHERFGALGGAEANVIITAGELKKRGHSVGLLHGESTGKNENAWNEVFENRWLLREGAEGKGVGEAVSNFQPDALYLHKHSSIELLERMLGTGLPLVRMVHDHDIYCMRSYKYNVLTRAVCHHPAGWRCIFPCGAFLARDRQGRWPAKYVSYSDKRREIELNRRFDRMLVVTRYMKRELEQNGFDPSKIDIMPPVPRMGDTSIRSNFSDRNLIVYAGQIIRGKGVDVLLQSLALVRGKFECVILGDGNHRKKCQALCQKLGLEERVKFAGFVSQEELKNYYRECTVVAISSVWPEPIATIGLEVLRYGLPVVAFDAGGISDWLHDGENGFLVPWMDRAAFAKAIDQLLADKQMARSMGEAGRQFVTRELDFDEYIGKLEKLFVQLAAENRGAAGRAAGVPEFGNTLLKDAPTAGKVRDPMGTAVE